MNVRLNPGDIVAGCKVISFLGSGGEGEVYCCEHLLLHVPRAVKLFHADLDHTGYEELFREAKLASLLQNEHIVAVYDVGVDSVLHAAYSVMEYVPGGSLRKRLLQNGPLPEAELFSIACQLGDALKCAAAKGLVHRDIKPDNLMIGEGGVIKLADLGIAWRIGEETRFFAATPAYASPEQCRGEEVDARSDLYSLGAALFELATGQRPFRDGAAHEVIQAVCHDAPDGRLLRRHLSNDFSRLILQLLEKIPADRPASAAIFLQKLKRCRPSNVKKRMIQYGIGTTVIVAAVIGLFFLKRPLVERVSPPANMLNGKMFVLSGDAAGLLEFCSNNNVTPGELFLRHGAWFDLLELDKRQTVIFLKELRCKGVRLPLHFVKRFWAEAPEPIIREFLPELTRDDPWRFFEENVARFEHPELVFSELLEYGAKRPDQQLPLRIVKKFQCVSHGLTALARSMIENGFSLKGAWKQILVLPDNEELVRLCLLNGIQPGEEELLTVAELKRSELVKMLQQAGAPLTPRVREVLQGARLAEQQSVRNEDRSDLPVR